MPSRLPFLSFLSFHDDTASRNSRCHLSSLSGFGPLRGSDVDVRLMTRHGESLARPRLGVDQQDWFFRLPKLILGHQATCIISSRDVFITSRIKGGLVGLVVWSRERDSVTYAVTCLCGGRNPFVSSSSVPSPAFASKPCPPTKGHLSFSHHP